MVVLSVLVATGLEVTGVLVVIAVVMVATAEAMVVTAEVMTGAPEVIAVVMTGVREVTAGLLGTEVQRTGGQAIVVIEPFLGNTQTPQISILSSKI
jgi:hypothetical protein